jgi:hypothetical protein
MGRGSFTAFTYLANIRPQHAEQILLTLGLPRLELLAQLDHHPASITFSSELRRTENAADAVSRHEFHSIVRSHKSPLADCLTSADDLSILLAAARGLVD